MNKIEKCFKAEKCFCGASVCICEAGGSWRVHCMDCDWSFGGSSLMINENKEAVIKEWNKRVRAARKGSKLRRTKCQ